ncbi:MAG TPA: glycosyltransferase family 39 protein, partial [Rhodopila sp.]
MFWLDRTSLWADEVFSFHWSLLDPDFLLGQGKRLEVNPPAYYLLLHGWMHLVGTSVFAVRSLSVLCSVPTVLAAYAIGWRLNGRHAALLAGFFLAINPLSIYFAQEARGYALLDLFDSVALVGLCYALAEPTNERRRLLWIALFSVAVVAAFRVHYTTLFFIGACFVPVALNLLRSRPFFWRRVLPWVGCGLFIAAGIALPLQTAVSMSHSADIAWMGSLDLREIWRFIVQIFSYPGGGHNNLLVGGAESVLAMVVAAGLLQRSPDALQFNIMILVPVSYCVFLIAASLVRPMLLSRVAVWLSLPICLLLAYATLAQPRKWRGFSLIAVATIFLGLTIDYFVIQPREDWSAAVRALTANPRCQGPIVAFGPYNLELQHYQPSIAARPMYWVRPYHGMPETSESVLDAMLTHDLPLEPEDLVAFMQAHPGAAFVVRQIHYQTALSLLGNMADKMRV